jgi:DNA polymerase-3 subunit epsilon/exodeoxyribonuclease X
MSVTHITNRMVENKEVFIGSLMYQELEKIFANNNVMVAHNAGFDAGILEKEGILINRFIDTHKIAHHLDVDSELPKHNLQYLRYFYDLEVENASAHDALGDVRVLEKLFDYFFNKMMMEVRDEEKVLDRMLEISAMPILIKKFNFGKYFGELVSEVAKKDSGYLSWLFNQKVMDRENGIANDENWIFTLDKYLNQNKLF